MLFPDEMVRLKLRYLTCKMRRPGEGARVTVWELNKAIKVRSRAQGVLSEYQLSMLLWRVRRQSKQLLETLVYRLYWALCKVRARSGITSPCVFRLTN